MPFGLNMQSFTRSRLGVDDDVGDLRALAPDPLLDLARPRVGVRERHVPGRAPSVRNATSPPSVWRKRSSRGGVPVASRDDAPHGLAPPATSSAVARRPARSSASGSRCVCTASTSGTPSRIARSTSVGDLVRLLERQLAGQLQVERDAPCGRRRRATRGCGSPARRGTRERGRVGALAQRDLVGARLDVDDDVALRQRALRPPPRPRRPPRGPARPRPRGDTPITTSAKWRPAACRIRSRRSSTARHDRRDRLRARPPPPRPARGPSARRCSAASAAPAARSTSTATKSAATESPSGCPARASSSPTSTATEPARSLPKWSAFAPSAALVVAPRRAPRDDRRATTSIAITTHDGRERVPRRIDRRLRRADEARDRAVADRDRSRATRNEASASAARCSALPWPYWWPGSAGRAATPTAKKVSSAATRSVPECAASERRPRLCVARPTPSLSATSAAAATTETSAVFRCGDIGRSMAAGYVEGPPERALEASSCGDRGTSGRRCRRGSAPASIVPAPWPLSLQWW